MFLTKNAKIAGNQHEQTKQIKPNKHESHHLYEVEYGYGDGNLKCYPRLLDSRMEVFSTSRRFCPQNRATYVPFPIRSSCSICSPVSWDSHMVNVNTLHPIHITTPYSLVKCYKNCQCFAKSSIHWVWSKNQ